MSEDSQVLRRIMRLQILTIAWMTVEAIVGLGAAWTAHSPALLGFGGDSVAEFLSAIIVFWRFRVGSDSEQSERLAARVAGALLFAVAGLVIISSGLALLGDRKPQPSLIGIGLLIVASIGMPWLAAQKRRLGGQLASAALTADAAESSVCGYLSVIALAGLLINAIVHAPWADPISALALLPHIVREGWEAVSASRSCCEV